MSSMNIFLKTPIWLIGPPKVIKPIGHNFLASASLEMGASSLTDTVFSMSNYEVSVMELQLFNQFNNP